MMHREAETQLSEVQVQVVGTVYIPDFTDEKNRGTERSQ